MPHFHVFELHCTATATATKYGDGNRNGHDILYNILDEKKGKGEDVLCVVK